MHFIVGLGVLAVLVGFAFGEKAARYMVGAVLSCTAFLAMALVFGVAVGVIQ